MEATHWAEWYMSLHIQLLFHASYLSCVCNKAYYSYIWNKYFSRATEELYLLHVQISFVVHCFHILVQERCGTTYIAFTSITTKMFCTCILHTVFSWMSVSAFINFKFLCPGDHLITARICDSVFWAPANIMSSFDPVLIRDQALIWDPALKRGKMVFIS